MGRTGQKLINYHSSNTSATSVFDVTKIDYGEIAVRHNVGQPELYIKTGENTYAVFADTAKTEAMINVAKGQIDSSINDIELKYGAFSSNVYTNYATKSELNTASGNIVTTLSNEIYSTSGKIEQHLTTYYATSANVATAIEGAAGSAGAVENLLKAFSAKVYNDYALTSYVDTQDQDYYSQATGYTDTVSGKIATHLTKYYATSADTYKAITGATQKVTDLDTKYGAFSSNVHTNYVTSANVHSAILAASGNVYKTATGYTHDVSGYIATHLTKNYATSADTYNAIESVRGTTTSLDNDIKSLSAGTIKFSGDVVNYIDTKLTNVYTFKGSVDTYAQLTGKTGMVKGDVWNVVGAQGTQGEAGYVPAGTNYAWTGTEWDALGGTIDLSTYALQSDVNEVDGRVTGLDNKYGAFSSNVHTNYATKEYANQTASTAYNNAVTYTNNASGYILTYLEDNYAKSGDTYNAITAATSTTSNLENTLKAFSGAVYSDYALTSYVNTQDQSYYAQATGYTHDVSGYIATHLTKNYATSADTYKAVTGATQKVTDLDTKYGAFSSNVHTNYATSANVYSAILAASGNVYKTATGYTHDVSGYIATHLAKNYATSADTHKAITAATQMGTNLDAKYGAFSANMTTVYVPKIDSALQGFQLGAVDSGTADSNQSRAYTKTINNVATLDLSNLVIDCGDF